MSNQGFKNNGVNGTGTTSCEGTTTWPGLCRSSSSNGSNERENEVGKGSKQDRKWVLDKEWAHKKKI